MIRKLTLALAASLWASLAFGQANNDSNFQTPGNAVIGSAVQMCVSTAGRAVPCSTAVAGAAGFPNGATPVLNGATGTTAAVTATLPATAGKFTYICGLTFNIGTATSAITVTITTAGLSSNFSYSALIPATATAAVTYPVTVTFPQCLPSSAVNTAISVTQGGYGAGGINNDVNVWGFQL